MITTEDIRRWATALPEVEETSHFRFHVPLFKVRRKTFAGMGKDERSAVFCVSEQEAGLATAADPATFEAVQRMDARRSFLGLQVELSKRLRGAHQGAGPRRMAPPSAQTTGSRLRQGHIVVGAVDGSPSGGLHVRMRWPNMTSLAR